MITKEDLINLNLPEDKANQTIELLGDIGKQLTSEIIVEKRIKKAFDDMDLETLNMTKIPKKDNEKATEYRKRATIEFIDKSLKEKSTNLNDKIIELEEKLKNHKGDETLKNELSQLKEEKEKREAEFIITLDEKTKGLKDKFETLAKEYEGFKIKSTLKMAIPSHLKKEYSHDYIDYKIEQAIEKAINNYDKIEKDKEGNIILRNSEKFESIKATDFFNINLKDIIEENQNQSGGGSGGNEGNEGGEKGELIIDETLQKNEKETLIRDYVIHTLGLSPTSEQYVEKIRDLKIQHKLISEKVKK